jgi:hypothetical protein
MNRSEYNMALKEINKEIEKLNEDNKYEREELIENVMKDIIELIGNALEIDLENKEPSAVVDGEELEPYELPTKIKPIVIDIDWEAEDKDINKEAMKMVEKEVKEAGWKMTIDKKGFINLY